METREPHQGLYQYAKLAKGKEYKSVVLIHEETPTRG